MVHQKLSNRLSWGMHAIDGWYIGPALESYHCYCVWIWETCMECICDTLVWYPTKVNLPTVSNTNLILAALQDILQILWNPLPDQSLPPLDPTHVQALINTSNLLTQVISPNSSKSLRVGTEAKKSNGVPTPTPAQPKPVADILEPTSWPSLTTITAPTQWRSHCNRCAPCSVPTEPTPAPPAETLPTPHEDMLLMHAAAAYTTSDYHLAWHKTTVNPDTGCVAKYPKLSQCSDGAHWIKSNRDEIGH